MSLKNTSVVRQTQFASLGTNQTTTSTTAVTLLSLTINTNGASSLLIFAAAGWSNATASDSVKGGVTVDGTILNSAAGGGGLASREVTASSSGLVNQVHKTAVLASGLHTINIFWLISAGTAQCRPVATTTEYATLVVMEVMK